MFVDDGRKEETRGAGRQLLLRGWVLLSLTWGRVCRATVSAEQGGNKGAGWSASEEEAGLRTGGVGANHAVLTGLPVHQEGGWADATGCMVTATPCHLRGTHPDPSHPGETWRIPCPS